MKWVYVVSHNEGVIAVAASEAAAQDIREGHLIVYGNNYGRVRIERWEVEE